MAEQLQGRVLRARAIDVVLRLQAAAAAGDASVRKIARSDLDLQSTGSMTRITGDVLTAAACDLLLQCTEQQQQQQHPAQSKTVVVITGSSSLQGGFSPLLPLLSLLSRSTSSISGQSAKRVTLLSP